MHKETAFKILLYILIPLQLLIFTFLVPPFQKPDEKPHFEKSLLISKGYLFCQKKSNNTVPLEKKYIDFIKRGPEKTDFNIDYLCSFPVISYLPQALALVIASIFKLNPLLSLYFGRLAMALLGYFWFLYLYRKISDNYKLIVLFTFSLPMTLHQISSFSYDALHIMLALTFFTLIMNYRLKKRLDSWIYLKLFFVLFLFLSSKKIGYETFYLFLFLLPFKIKSMIVSTVIFIPFYFLSKITGSYDLQYSLTNLVYNPLQQLNFLLSDPFNILKVIAITTIQRLGFYLQSMIGIFGWLEYGLDPLSYLIYGLLFVYVIVGTIHELSLQKYKTILLFLTLLISYIFIVLLAFVFNTTAGVLTAHGIQGRYFIPFLPFIIFFIIQIKTSPIFQKVLYLSIVIFLISATFYAVFKRYYW
ncbi:MAG: hypothetical protein US40_C0001G0068 [Candidatus Roizmanbacteria bacterium GW2011_GWC2_37_13]|uniref:Glycosyltransferase RgtA/B/C/D-like domain-containing protein n=1 Tax=Candidatus Roizmanbacteria bacterium GW2011_GWC2_37_13 TaxID=1618486 RepID=A0A0G0IRD0_9BACT|nr:MAG: hypothetical protein US38_C0002G0068 [Candidatus Roizmanbacteria bacterium GW2011_GWC1_37_12]KKQ26719.1 MAG: hypothetical protein US40_C0001G0068 [Candidatus Roizmanbacteria bacterium GW2011_GWC2_37_13]